MDSQEDQAPAESDYPVLGQEVQVIVVDISGVRPFVRFSEVPLVVKISAAAGAKYRVEFELLDRLTPHLQAFTPALFGHIGPTHPQSELARNEIDHARHQQTGDHNRPDGQWPF